MVLAKGKSRQDRNRVNRQHLNIPYDKPEQNH